MLMSKTDTVTAPTDGTEVSIGDLSSKVEVALMATDRPLTAARLGEVIAGEGATLPAKAVKDAVAALNQSYERTGRTFRIEQVAGGWQIMTLSQYADVVASLNRSRAQTRLTPAQLETLAIIAYKQPVLKAQVEAIRGVACGEVIRALMDRRMVKIVGRAEELGRPMLYGTTKAFLEVFGLNALKDLPKVEEMKK